MKAEDRHIIGKSISILHRYGQIFINGEFKELSIGKGQYMILICLFYHDGITQDDVTKKIKIDKANVARGVKKLEENGYVIRQVDPDDKRAYRLHLTEKAIKVKPYIYESLAKWMDIITDGISADEIEQFINTITKLTINACEYSGDVKLANHLKSKER
ncbi:MarR family winged helix-turn-helix transcriptional regulator [Tepidibacter hydrothermalis]|uniref:MarR family transcriptional regulator n=1 Tax=Tepidibacter hydrothermalis TaxID=3036126 RepID=A0ABY8EIN9_9FIRM|nr:MarR family transcriptional regulator [Tepidibacter hydrothermalis]WFD10800.1 MarR family transcriptional regulator [Tepidibacter hydrothermalis]